MAKKYIVTVNGTGYEVIVEEAALNANFNTAPAAAPAPAAPVAAGGTEVKAPMPGNIFDVKVAPGASVKAGDVVAVLEAMKMENDIVAPVDGTIGVVAVKKGDTVNTDDLIVTIQ